MTAPLPRTTSSDFFTYGIDGINLSRAAERRATERERDQVSAALHAAGRPSSLRRWLGSMLVAIGTAVAGQPAPRPGIEVTTRSGLNLIS